MLDTIIPYHQTPSVTKNGLKNFGMCAIRPYL